MKIQSKKWIKVFDSILYKCFRKVRVVKKKKEAQKCNKIMEEKRKLEKDNKNKVVTEEIKSDIVNRIKQIEKDIEKEITEENIKETVEAIKSLSGSNKSKEMWKLLKNNYPKILPAVPVGKKDRSGNLITNHEGLKHLYQQTYIERLRNRPMKAEFEELYKLKKCSQTDIRNDFGYALKSFQNSEQNPVCVLLSCILL